MRRHFEAPGKVVLLGEYAVLDGAPAIVTAVDSGVACIVEPAATLEIVSPEGDAYVSAALQAVGAPPARYRFEIWNPPPTSTKAGLGGSAAATAVAVLAGATLASTDTPERPELNRIATRIHRTVQGSGSGIDVAASVFGGTLRFERGRAEKRRPVEPVVVWSGSSAATAPRIEAYLKWEPRDAFVDDTWRIVDAFDDDPVQALREAGALLYRMSVAAGLAYLTPELDRIGQIAHDHGGAAKPSGAGGGDCAVALFDDPDAAEAFRSACRADGFVVLDVHPASMGVSEVNPA